MEFSKIYHEYNSRLFRISYSITRDIHTAEDVVHETFIKAINKMDTLEDENKMGAWLSSIATRTAIDFVRMERNKKGTPMDHELIECLGKTMKQNVEEEVETNMVMEQIYQATRKLKQEYQDVLTLKIWHGLQENQIAHILNLKPCTVKTRIYRARKELRGFLVKWELSNDPARLINV
ncbi:sigma-70 family RNA polymerase sigma factor [Fredinandcohnia sp. QZ13]|uniref:RNA polymerase sigma factor n=1 Tax=Fredinandcohnia sp. QZ13 TaxID=3073144 RepID=UPI002852FE7E|nr:sigma-70 family RNA polymerase sigma factor [Fredinandcohnia sp. QZ13]MDR4887734.1 sigma-70 family RNA polymerase sigma factor [Fredinandcohnia sp. QZ13]